MSSPIQSSGRMDFQRGVEIFVYLQREERKHLSDDFSYPRKVDVEPEKLPGVKYEVPKVYRIWRKPVGMLGCWVLFFINGEKLSPDMSVPLGLEKLPQDAEEMTEEERVAYWTRH